MFSLPVCRFLAIVAIGAALAMFVEAADPPPEAKQGFTLSLERIGASGIPSLVLSKNGSETAKRPAVILMHGGSVFDSVLTPGLPYKEEWFRPVYEDVPYGLAEKGMLVVAIDAAWAESRIPPEAARQVADKPIETLFTYYIAGIRDFSDTTDYLLTRPDVDPDRLAAAGKSGGAIACLMAACKEPRLAVIVAWKGAADIRETMRQKGQEAAYLSAIEQNPDFESALKRADPIFNYDQIPPKALALINNRNDPAIPREGAEALYAKLLPLYEKTPGRLLLKLCDTNKPTHDDQIEAFDAGRQWLEQHLLPHASPSE